MQATFYPTSGIGDFRLSQLYQPADVFSQVGQANRADSEQREYKVQDGRGPHLVVEQFAIAKSGSFFFSPV